MSAARGERGGKRDRRRGIGNGDAARREGSLRVLFLVNLDAVTSIPIELAGAIARKGVDVEVISFYEHRDRPPAGPTPIRTLAARSPVDPRAWRRLGAILRRRPPDVLHLHHTASAVAGALLARVRTVPAVVKTEHYHHDQASIGQVVANALVLGLVDGVVANSRATRDSFRPWERLLGGEGMVVHNGVDLRRIESAAAVRDARRRLRIPPSSFLVGGVGRLVRVKSFAILLRAVAAAGTTDRRLELVVAGGGPRAGALRATADRLGIGDRVRFTGEIDRREVYELLGALDLFVVSSSSEGFCNAVVEAMAAGVPVLCSDLPALREVVGDAGMYAEPGDPGSFAAGIEQIAAWSEEERRARGEAGRVRARKRFSLDRSARRYLAVYGSLLGRENQGPQG